MSRVKDITQRLFDSGDGVRRGGPAVSLRRRLAGALLAAAGIPVLTLLLLSMDHAELSTALLSYLALTMLVATVGGVWPSVPTAVFCYGCAKWFFTPPFRTWIVDRGQDVLALAVFLGVAVVVSLLVHLVERRAADAALLAEGNRLRTALLSAASHDLRTPLATIKAWLTGLLEGDVSFSPRDVDEILSAAVGEVDRLNALVGNLLDMSRLQTGVVHVHRRPVALDAVTSAAVATLSYGRRRLHVEIPDSLPRVSCDEALLERIVANLVDNALRHTPEETRVDVRAGCGADDDVVLRIIDHGPGPVALPADAQLRPFTGGRSGTSGAGLGLAVAKGLSDAIDADLAVRDTPGGGTTMMLTLRAAA